MTDKQIQTQPILNEIQAKYQEAQYLAQANILPKHFIDQPGNVLVALEYARQLSNERRGTISPIAIMQNLYVVHGNCGLSSKFMIALANSSGKFDTSLKFHVDRSNKNNIAVECYSSIEGERVSYRVDMEMAKAEGWTKNPKYKTMGELMLSYRAAAFLIRLNAPEVVMGLATDDDVKDAEFEDNPSPVAIEDTAAKEEVKEIAPEPTLIKEHEQFKVMKAILEEKGIEEDLNKAMSAEEGYENESIKKFNSAFDWARKHPGKGEG